MLKVPAPPRTLGRTTILALATLLGALLACRHNGPNQPGTVTGAEASHPSGSADAAAPDAAAPDGAISDAGAPATSAAAPASLLEGGRACKLGGATAVEGSQVMLFRDAYDFVSLLAAADAGANQQQRTERFRNAGGVLVPSGTPCSAFETQSAAVRVQITEGAWLGSQGWVPAESVTYQ